MMTRTLRLDTCAQAARARAESSAAIITVIMMATAANASHGDPRLPRGRTSMFFAVALQHISAGNRDLGRRCKSQGGGAAASLPD